MPVATEPSAYDKMRMENIARNQAFLESLGLSQTRDSLRNLTATSNAISTTSTVSTANVMTARSEDGTTKEGNHQNNKCAARVIAKRATIDRAVKRIKTSNNVSDNATAVLPEQQPVQEGLDDETANVVKADSNASAEQPPAISLLPPTDNVMKVKFIDMMVTISFNYNAIVQVNNPENKLFLEKRFLYQVLLHNSDGKDEVRIVLLVRWDEEQCEFMVESSLYRTSDRNPGSQMAHNINTELLCKIAVASYRLRGNKCPDFVLEPEFEKTRFNDPYFWVS